MNLAFIHQIRNIMTKVGLSTVSSVKPRPWWKAGWVQWGLVKGRDRQETKHGAPAENKGPFSLLSQATVRQPALVDKLTLDLLWSTPSPQLISQPVCEISLWTPARGILRWSTVTHWPVSQEPLAVKHSSPKNDILHEHPSVILHFFMFIVCDAICIFNILVSGYKNGALASLWD